MTAMTNYTEESIAKLIFQAKAWADIAENDATSPLLSLFVSLHTADPTDAPGTEQNTSETTYTGYARKGLLRTSADWAVSTGGTTVADNVAAITFGTGTGGSGTVTHVGIGTLTSGAGKLLFQGTCSNLVVGIGVTPNFPIGTLDVEFR